MTIRRASSWLTAAVAIAACGIDDTGPIALDDRIAADPGATVVHDVLANDRAPQGATLALESVRGARGSVVVLDDRRVEYTATSTGDTDSFVYVAVTDDGQRVEATVEVVIGTPTPTPTPTSAPPPTTERDSPTSVPTTDQVQPPRVDPTELGFETVEVGVRERRALTLIAGDEPWTPNFSDVGLIPDMTVDHACGEIPAGSNCEATIIWTPESPGALDRTVRLRDDVPLRVVGVAALAPPEWITPSDGDRLWIDLLRRGIIVEVSEVRGADDHRVVAEFCGGDDCTLPGLVVDRVGGSTTFFVGSADPDRLAEIGKAIIGSGLQPRLRLTASASSAGVASADATIVVPLTDRPMDARLVSYRPEPPATCPDLRTTVDIDSFMLTSVPVVARYVRTTSDGTFTQPTGTVDVAPGADRWTFDVDNLRLTFDTIELEVVGDESSSVVVEGATAYENSGCVE